MVSTDPRIVALYDIDNPGGADHDFYRALADEIQAETIVDLGCGTGLLTVSLASAGRSVSGIDPDDGMLAYARRRPGAEQVEWVPGDSRAIPEGGVDVVLMTGNVAQHIGDEGWQRTLGDIASSLRPGGRLAFESRNPVAREWLRWDRAHTHGRRDTANGPLTEWLEVTDVDIPASSTEVGDRRSGTVAFDAHNIFEDTGEHLVITETLTFRDVDRIRADLAAAGLEVQDIWGELATRSVHLRCAWHGVRGAASRVRTSRRCAEPGADGSRIRHGAHSQAEPR